MDEDIIKLIKYINSNYKNKDKIIVNQLIKNGFDKQIINEAKRLDFIEIWPLVHTHRDGRVEDVSECKLTKEGLKFVNELKEKKSSIKIGTQNIVNKLEDKSIKIGNNNY